MKYELKKLAVSKSVFLALVLLAVLFAFITRRYLKATEGLLETSEGYKKITEEMQTYEGTSEEVCTAVEKRLSELEGRVFENPLSAQNIAGEYGENLMADFLLYGKAAEQALYVSRDFEDSRISIIEDSLYTINNEQEKAAPDLYTIRSHVKVIEKYNERIMLELGNVGSAEFYEGFNGTIVDYLAAVFLVLLTTIAFTGDRSSGMFDLTATCKKGGFPLFRKRFGAVLLYSFAVFVVLSICEILFAVTYFGCESLLLPIQTYARWEMCTLEISILGFFILKLLCKLLFAAVICSVTMLLSVLLKKPLKTIISAGVLSVAPMLLLNWVYGKAAVGDYNMHSVHDTLRSLLPSALLDIDKYIRKFDYMNLFDYPVLRLSVTVLISIIIVLACTVLGFYYFRSPIRPELRAGKADKKDSAMV